MTTTTGYGTWGNVVGALHFYGEDTAAFAESGIDLDALVSERLPDGVLLLGNGEFIGPAYGDDYSPEHAALYAEDETVRCEHCDQQAGWLHALVHETFLVAADV